MSYRSRIAFCTVPHVGGIYSVYQKLRSSVGPLGWEVFGVQIGDELDRWEYCDDLIDGGIRRVVPHETDLKTAAKEFARWVDSEDVTIVMPMASPAAMAAIPHLPPHVKVVTRCISVSIQSYRLAASNASRLSRIVVTSPQQKQAIASRFNIPDPMFCHIPNAVDANVFSPTTGNRDADPSKLSALYLGRLLQLQKNIFALPTICDGLERTGIPFKLSIVGSGSDEAELRNRMSVHVDSGKVAFLGALYQSDVVALLQSCDCLILPSEQEGFPNALIEAMACGVVPVASRLPGVTDWIVDDRITGMLCHADQPDSFVSALTELFRSPDLRRSLGQAARKAVCERFAIQQFADNWSSLFAEVAKAPLYDQAPLSWDEFKPNPAFERSRFSRIPRRYRNAIRSILDKVGLNTR